MDNSQDDSLDNAFLPMWDVDEEAIVSARSFTDFTEANSYSVKYKISEYKIIDKSGAEKIVKADSAHQALVDSGIKDPVSIIFLEPVSKAFLDEESLEETK